MIIFKWLGWSGIASVAKSTGLKTRHYKNGDKSTAKSGCATRSEVEEEKGRAKARPLGTG
jgi:hypothetical protein